MVGKPDFEVATCIISVDNFQRFVKGVQSKLRATIPCTGVAHLRDYVFAVNEQANKQACPLTLVVLQIMQALESPHQLCVLSSLIEFRQVRRGGQDGIRLRLEAYPGRRLRLVFISNKIGPFANRGQR